ncbi:MAG: terpene cyclase/mutase family protein [Phycisphaerae bacterium]|jgi:hypothetical protein
MRAGGSKIITGLLLTGAAAWASGPLRAEVPPPLPKGITPETQSAIDRGLDYLARTQSREGAWREQGYMGSYPVAMTSLAGLAFLANGSTMTQGKYAPNVSRAANFILSSCGSTGLISRQEEEGRSMHGHGFALLFLGELYGMEDDAERQARIRRVLQAGVTLTARSQSRRGGWIYTPDATDDEGSVTVTQLQGMRSARNAGIAVPKEVVDKALKYLEMSSLPSGGITYKADRAGGPRPPITAAAVVCWYNAGDFDNPLCKKALTFVKGQVGRGDNRGANWGHYYYAHLYMAQAMWLSGEENWEWYFPAMREKLLAMQAADGSWDGDQVGRVYGTAIATTILQLPYNNLPIMQR